jgi:hypothetical protein
MRSAAPRRWASERGRPCATFCSTPRERPCPRCRRRTSPRSWSAPRAWPPGPRWYPSVTRIVPRCTRIGGSVSSTSANLRVCAVSSPDSRGESRGPTH